MDRQLLSLTNGALHAITSATSQDDVQEALQEFVAGCGYESFGLARDFNLPNWVGEPDMATWPRALVEGYIRFETVRFDLTLAALRSGERQCHWTRENVFTDKQANPLMRVLHDVDLVGGFVVSLRAGGSSCGALSLSADHRERASPELIEASRLLGDVALVRMSCLQAAHKPAHRTAQLTERQLEILAWVARGKSNRDIAAIMGVTERSVTYHMSEVLRRLGVSSRTQAAAWLLGGGRTYTGI